MHTSKKRQIIVFIVVILCFLAGLVCMVYQNKTLQGEYKELQNRAKELQEEKTALEVLTEHIAEEKSLLAEQVDLQKNAWQEQINVLQNFHMEPPETEHLDRIYTGTYMAGEDTKLYKIPSENELFYTGIQLSYERVTPIYTVIESITDRSQWDEDRHWVLVSIYPFGEMVDSVGWIKYSDLIEYTSETKKLYRGPFRLADNAVDIETGKPVDALFLNTWVSVTFTEDYARVGAAGGVSCKVSPEFVIYP